MDKRQEKLKMDNSIEEVDNAASSELRLILIGERWAGKSSSANTILRKERFECGRTRTAQAEVRHEVVEGRKLTVVDAPGWSHSLSLSDIPEGDKQRFKLNTSKCPPGPNAFLLVIPIDTAFSVEQRITIEQHMKLLGEQQVWKFTIVLFTYGDFLGEKMIEQHIESEGQALRWLMDKCGNRYHVFNNKDKGNSSQVTLLLEKIEEMVRHNGGNHYKTDEQIFKIIKAKQQEVSEKAKERQRRAEEQRQHMMTLISEEMNPIPELRIIVLGSRRVGKTSVANTILGSKDREDGRRTVQSVVRKGFADKSAITLVDTPGWWKGFPAFDTPEVIKEEIMYSMFLCRPGPHVFLLVIDADASFNAKHLNAATTHMELLNEEVWKHTVVVFTRGDWLGTHTIEEYIEGEGEALKSLVEQCGNRYHVINNKNPNDRKQVTELLEKITGTVAGNGWGHFLPDEQMLVAIEERRRRVAEGAMLRQSSVEAKRRFLGGSRNKLQELKIVMLGQKKSGKSATGNTILRKKVFASCQTEQCNMEEREVAGRMITLIDTPGWWKESSCCIKEMDREIVQGLLMSQSGVHAVLLVVALDQKFTEAQRIILEEHMNLFEVSIWKHTIVLFTHGDKLADRSIEEHIERENLHLNWLVDKCQNKYHTINNMREADTSQVTELFEKIEEMVAENRGQLFCPNQSDIELRIYEKLSRGQLKQVLKRQLLSEYRRRELALMTGFRDKLLELEEDISQSGVSSKPKSFFGEMAEGKANFGGLQETDEKKKEETVCAKISKEIEKLNEEIMKSTDLLWSSMDGLIPDLKDVCPTPSIAESLPQRNETISNFHKVLGWLSNIHIGTNVDNQLTLNFNQSSGYRSMTTLGSLMNEQL
ncbi:GTPase IMAP family member 8-like [Melanotaenia boesemani]|uniref:GTPase IMAP family member 8-like n=1 Tax=Melanotaenia boesemani TaxID=1250792 RepID=UPI001C046BC7|nr:GTPase IMAP family member 8-like [Melanotaenia boesemani]